MNIVERRIPTFPSWIRMSSSSVLGFAHSGKLATGIFVRDGGTPSKRTTPWMEPTVEGSMGIKGFGAFDLSED
jgi:hypothetical protein